MEFFFRKTNKMDGFRKKGTDYTDFAYKEAVSKLRYLLAESYTPSTGFSKYSLVCKLVVQFTVKNIHNRTTMQAQF